MAEEYGKSESWILNNLKINLWEKESSAGKGKKVGELLPGSRALMLKVGKEDYKVKSPYDKSIGWISNIQVKRVIKLDTSTYEPCESVADSTPTGIPKIIWSDSSRGRTLLSSGGLPKIPDWVKREGLKFTVEVSFSVIPEGHTISLVVNRSSGYPDVDASVLESARKLRFNPIQDDSYARGKIIYFIGNQ